MVGVRDLTPKGETVKVKKEYLQDLHGKSYITHPGLLDAVHQLGVKSVSTEIISYGGVGTEAVVKASIELDSGATFTGLGDASPENVSRNIATATLRMAETRALNRCYREASNLGHTTFEEMPASEPARAWSAPTNAKPQGQQRTAPAKSVSNYGHTPPSDKYICAECNVPMYDNSAMREQQKADKAAGRRDRNPGPALKCSNNEKHVFWELRDYVGPQDMPPAEATAPAPTPTPDFDDDVPF